MNSENRNNFSIKRRFAFEDSPSEDQFQTQPTSPLNEFSLKKRSAFKKLQFDNDSLCEYTNTENKTSLKIEPVCLFDENSCDSGFSDFKDTPISSQNLDDSLYQVDNLSFELFDQVENELPEQPSISEDFNEQSVKIALDTDQQNERLIGDMTRKHTLPILAKSKHNDLASITPETLFDLLNGKYKEQIGEYLIIDARYPYEFDGGHIKNAESGYQRDQLFDKLFNTVRDKPLVLIFHCEFSSERGPKLMRDLREKDRSLNKHSYPSLCYPEIYLLEGGYKDFYSQFVQECMPQSYLPMLHDKHRNDMKFFRKKSKTWGMETKKTRITKSKLSFDF